MIDDLASSIRQALPRGEHGRQLRHDVAHHRVVGPGRYIARHVIGCHSSQETRVQSALDAPWRAISARPYGVGELVRRVGAERRGALSLVSLVLSTVRALIPAEAMGTLRR